MSDIYIARQPIFDAKKQVIGYEILHRSGPTNAFVPIDPDVAAGTGVEHATMEVGLEELTDGRLAFVNVSRRVLLEEMYTLLPPERTVIELLETIEPDDAVVTACQRLKIQGYRLALDDFAGGPGMDELLELADIVKIEVLNESPQQALAKVAAHRRSGMQLLAEKVETPAVHRAAIESGYDYFQGYFFCRPEMIQARSLSPNELNALQFLTEVSREDASFERLEEIFHQDVSLSTRLLRYLKSAGFGWSHEISTLNHALRLVGLTQLRKWGAVMGLMSLTGDSSRELGATALVRAYFAEQIGRFGGRMGHELDCFIAGLLSLMDAMLGRPLPDVLAGMSVSDEVRGALVGGNSTLTPVLELVTSYEHAEWGDIHRLVADNNLSVDQVNEAYSIALRSMRQAMAI